MEDLAHLNANSAPTSGSGHLASSTIEASEAQRSFNASHFARTLAPVARTLAALDSEGSLRLGLPGLASVVERIIAAAIRVQQALAQRQDGVAVPVRVPLRVSYLVPPTNDVLALLREHYYPRLALLNGLPTLEIRPGLPLCALHGFDRTTHRAARLAGLEAYLTALLAHEHYHNEVQLQPAVPYPSVMEGASVRELLDTSADPFGYATMIRAYGLGSHLTRFGEPGAPMPAPSPEIESLFRAARNDCFLVRHRILGTSEPPAARLARSIRNSALKLLFEYGVETTALQIELAASPQFGERVIATADFRNAVIVPCAWQSASIHPSGAAARRRRIEQVSAAVAEALLSRHLHLSTATRRDR